MQERIRAPPEVLEFIATRIQSNIRELEGALIRVTAFASLNRQPVDLPSPRASSRTWSVRSDAPEITATTIMGLSPSEYFAVTVDDLTSSSRSRVLVAARQMAMYLCRELTELSLPRIGEKFGSRDHTTVLNAERKIRSLIAQSRSVYTQIAELTSRIKLRARTG